MFDSSSRNIHYLRLSVTDLCNLRCRYCMPDGVDKLEREDILKIGRASCRERVSSPV